MMTDAMHEVAEMQKKLVLKDYITEELLEELISRKAIKLRYEDDTTLLDVNV